MGSSWVHRVLFEYSSIFVCSHELYVLIFLYRGNAFLEASYDINKHNLVCSSVLSHEIHLSYFMVNIKVSDFSCCEMQTRRMVIVCMKVFQ